MPRLPFFTPLIAVALCGAFATPAASAAEISSPDGRLRVDVTVDEGRLAYQVAYDGEPMLLRSPLGVATDTADFTRGVQLVGDASIGDAGVSYKLPLGKCAEVDRPLRSAELAVQNAAGDRMTLLLRVANDGAALAYRFDDPRHAGSRVRDESTGFRLPAEATGFLHPMAVAKSGWSRTQPSYEELYSIDKPVGEPSTHGQGWCFPALFRVGERGWVLVSETGVGGDYCGMHLAHESPGGEYRLAFPQPPEHLPSADTHPRLPADGQTPWRFVVVGDSLAPIVETTLATDLVETRFETRTPPPGRAAWSWLVLKDDRTREPTQRAFIDMAASLGWEYVLIDSMWDQQIGKEKIAELTAYAAERGVSILLWYNSNGEWNDAPMTPKHRMHTPEAREEEMRWMQQVGVKGVKVDFFGGDKQAVMRLCEDILQDAARFGLSVNFHGTTLPRGWSRMYPNFVTNEAVLGMEFCTFSQEGADKQPVHCAVLPFTRNPVGPMDFTPLIANPRLGPNEDGPHRRTRLSYELALPALFFSPVTHFGLTPRDLERLPPPAVDYLRDLPTVWDETRHVAGYPGRYAAIARRNGDRWWLAAINGMDEEVSFDLPDDLSGLVWRTLKDAGFNEVAGGEHPAGEATISLPPRGGVVLQSRK